ncbi:MAG: YfcE family phosphodiesterase [Solirubrobacteraceae bacterium]|nr:YfcE family phosphodiesterase [Solirubrobacteraceae bacterium]
MKLAIISDTHLSAGLGAAEGRRALPDGTLDRLRAADAILHAGDLMREPVLDELLALGPPVHVIHGNADDDGVRARVPALLTMEFEGVTVVMTHNGGPADGRLARMRAKYPESDAVVFGHSHIPLHETSDDGAFQIFNPGSAADRRRAPNHTMGEALIRGGKIAFAHVDLD